jgi:glycosyltransferase involved in cell wall biosynthesis
MRTSAVLEPANEHANREASVNVNVNAASKANESTSTAQPRLRVAMLNRHFSRRAGGAEAYSIALVEGMAAQPARFDVHVFAQHIEHSHANVSYHLLPGPLSRPRWINQLLFATCSWWLTRRGFDVVHSHENTWHGQVQTVHVRPIRYNLLHEQKNAQGHTVAQSRSGWRLALRWLKIVTSPRLGVYVWLEAARMKAATHNPHTGASKVVVAVSQSLKNQTLKAYPHSDPDLPIITPGVAMPTPPVDAAHAQHMQSAARAALGLPQGVPLLLFVGNDYARKGLPTLLQALANLNSTAHTHTSLRTTEPLPTAAQPTLPAVPVLRALPALSKVHLAVIGKADTAPFETLAADLGLATQLHFLGSLQGVQAMAQAYQAADALAHPTLEDSYAMVVQEALSHGLPVVVSGAAHCGIAAHLQHQHNALILSDPRDANTLSHLIHRALFDTALRQHLRQQGLAFAQAHSAEQTLLAYLEIYARVSQRH